jgi:hypothetical protein
MSKTRLFQTRQWGMLLLAFCCFQLSAQFQRSSPTPSTTAYSNVGDCYPGASKWTTKDPQGYGRMFFNAYCKCKSGVANAQQEKQMVATMTSMHRAWKDFMTNDPSLPAPLRSCPKAAAGAAGGNSKSALSEEQKMRQTIANMRKGLDMVGRARGRAQQLSSDLEQLEKIVNTGDPFQIEADFKRVMQQIERLNSNLKNAINQQYLEDGLSTLSDYNSGNAEGALYSGLGMIGSIGENMEAKEQLEKKRREAIQQKNTAFQQAANQMIEANNAALQQYIEAAAVVLEEDREQYYMKKAIHHSCYAHAISNRFNYNNTNWAVNRCADMEEPIFKRYYAPLHEQHAAAAKRKMELYRQYSNPELREGAIKHMASAIHLQPQNTLYYVEMGRLTKPEDMVLSLSNYLAAYEMNPDLFTGALEEELREAIALASEDAAEAIRNNVVDRVKDYIDADLFDIIRIGDANMFTYAVLVDADISASLIYNLEIQAQEATLKQQNTEEALQTAAYYGSTTCLNQLLETGADPDAVIEGKSLLEYAAEGMRDETFLLLWTASRKQRQNLQRYGQHPVYIKAIAKVDPDASAAGLCSLTKGEVQHQTISEMLMEVPQKPYLLHALVRCTESKQQLTKDPLLQAQVQGVFRQALLQEGGTVSSNAALSDAFPEAILSSLSAEHQKLVLQEFQKATTQLQASESKSQFDEASSLLLEYDLLDQSFLQQQAPEITASLIRNDQLEAFRHWAQKGLIPDKRVDGTPMSYEFLQGGSRILSSGAARTLNFDATDTTGAGVLHSLIFVYRSPNTQYLINNSGANVNLAGPHGWTPLHYAVREQNTDLVKALLAAGADPDIEDEWGRTAEDIASERDFEQIEDLF